MKGVGNKRANYLMKNNVALCSSCENSLVLNFYENMPVYYLYNTSTACGQGLIDNDQLLHIGTSLIHLAQSRRDPLGAQRGEKQRKAIS